MHRCTHEQDEGRRNDVDEESRDDAHIASYVFARPQSVDHFLVVAELRLHVRGVERESVRDAAARLHPHAEDEAQPAVAEHVAEAVEKNHFRGRLAARDEGSRQVDGCLVPKSGGGTTF